MVMDLRIVTFSRDWTQDYQAKDGKVADKVLARLASGRKTNKSINRRE